MAKRSHQLWAAGARPFEFPSAPRYSETAGRGNTTDMPISSTFSIACAGVIAMLALTGCADSTMAPLGYSSAEPEPLSTPLSAPVNNPQVGSIARLGSVDSFIVDAGPPQPVDPQGSYYVEFRARWLHEAGPWTVLGHAYVVYGRLDSSGKPLDQHLVALYPRGGTGGLMLSFLGIPVLGSTMPEWGDAEFNTVAAYRENMSAAQYEALQDFVYKLRSKTNWFNLYSINCMYLVGQIAEVVGLKAPPFTLQPTGFYVTELAALNRKN